MAEKESKTKNQLLEEKVCLKKESSWKEYSGAKRQEVFKFSEEYKDFLKENKTERKCAESIVKLLKKNGFKDMTQLKALKKGDKAYKEIKGKAVIAFIVGKNPSKLKIVGSHIDSPRLDLKPTPLYEDSGLAMAKTHYYGSIKKYHWVNTPLSLQGVVYTKAGKKIEVSIGEKEGEPKFIIPDLLPHLSKDQMEKPAKDLIKGEDLNILLGHIPIEDDKIKEPLKLSVLQKLNEEYGLIEEDLIIAELELVPSGNPVDIGLDKGLVAGYGQDARVCVYAGLKALIATTSPPNTALGLYVDKEETGSMGDTGARSLILVNFAREYVKLAGLKENANTVLEQSKAISADVTGAMNPNFKEVQDPLNATMLGKGVSIEKYAGGGGKYYTNDASAEYMSYIRSILDKNRIAWQTGELGKQDIGGGGTIAAHLSQYGMECVDAGPGVLGMHSPCEVSSKADIYSAYKLYKAFYED